MAKLQSPAWYEGFAEALVEAADHAELSASPARLRDVADHIRAMAAELAALREKQRIDQQQCDDMTAEAGRLAEENRRLRELARDVRDNYDCDEDAHRYNTAGCRRCKASCNYDHIGIAWANPGPCPLCACFERIEELESALREAANSLGTLAVASNQNGFEDLIDVRGYANSRWTVACELLPETRCRCSRCGCLPTRHRPDDEELRECLDCECTEYES